MEGYLFREYRKCDSKASVIIQKSTMIFDFAIK
jgi:hypothetical protein